MLRETLADFCAYLAAPRLIQPVPLRAGWARWAIIVAAYLLGLLALAPALAWWGSLHHLSAAPAFGGYSRVPLVLGVVLLFPLCEEVAFRGWLTGRPRALWLLLTGLSAAALLGAVVLQWHDQVASIAVLLMLPVALAGWWTLRKRTIPPPWFADRFGWWFYGSVAVFGLLHLANYGRFNWAALPLVVPQLWAGLVFGYLRMRHGLWASALAHAAGNAATLAAALLFV